MADDDKVFRLSFVLNAQQFNADVNQSSANTISKIASIIEADGRFTDVTVQNIQKRSTAQTQGAAAANASLSTQAAALSKIAAATATFGPATERVVTFTNKLQSFATLTRNFGDPFVNEVNRTQKAVNDASAYLLKFENDAGKAVEAAIALANAQKALANAQANLSTARTVTAGPGGENAAIEAIVKVYNDALNSAQAYARRGLDPVIAKHDALTASARSMTSELAAVNKAFESGIISQSKAVDLNNKIEESYSLAATEARKFAEEQAKVNAAVQSILNPSTPGQGRNFAGGSGGGFGPPGGGGGGPPGSGSPPNFPPSGNDLRAAAVSSQDLIAGAKESAAQLAKDTQAYYNTILGVDQSVGRIAKDSAAVFEENASATEKLRDQLNPILPLARALNDQIALIGIASLSTSEKTEALKQAYDRFKTSVSNLPDARNQAAMADSAQRLRDQVDPLAAAFRTYGEAVAQADKLVASGNLSYAERDQAVKLAQYTFETASASIRKEAQTTYDALKAASEDFQKSQGTGRVGVGPIAPTAQVTSANALLAQVQPNIASGQKIDPATIQQINQLVQELTQLKTAEDNAAASAQKLKDQLDPIAAVQRNLNATLMEYDDLLAKDRISQDQATDAKKRANDAAKATIQDLSGVTAAQSDYERLSKAAQDYRENLNPLIEVQRRYNEAIAQQKEFVSVGLLPQKQATVTIEDYTAKVKALEVSLQQADAQGLNRGQILKTYSAQIRQAAIDTGSFGETSGKAFALSRGGLLELQAAGVNTFQSLAAGISPLRTIETEGAQVLGGILQLGLGLRTLVSIVAPILAVAAAIGAVAIAIGSAVARTTEIKQLNVALETFHQTSTTTAKDLIEVQKQFEKTGESSTTLKTAIAELSRNPNINPAAIGSIIGVAQNLGAALGTDTAGGIKELMTALDGGAEGILNLGNKLRALTVEQGTEILRLNETGHAQDAVAKGYQLIADHLKPYQDSLGPIELLTRSITGVWNQFIESIKESGPIQNAVDYIKSLTDRLTTLKNQLATQRETGATPSTLEVAHGALRSVLGLSPQAPPSIGANIISGIQGAAGAVSNLIPSLSSSLAAPVVSTYNQQNVPTSNILTDFNKIDSSIVTLSSSLDTTKDNVLKFNTQIQTSTTNSKEQYSTQDKFSTMLDNTGMSLGKLTIALDTATTTAANFKLPTNIGGMSVGGGAGPSPSTVNLFNSPFFNALASLESGGRNITQQITDVNTTRGTPAEGIFQITRPTFQQFGGQTGFASALEAPALTQAQVASNIPLRRFGENTRSGLINQFGPLDINQTVGQLNANLGFAPVAGVNGPTVGSIVPVTKAQEDQNNATRSAIAIFKELTPALKMFGSDQEALTAIINTYSTVLKSSNSEDLANAAAKQAAIEIITRKTAEIGKETDVQTLSNKVLLDAAKITSTDEVAGIRAAAQASAELQRQQEPLINVQQKANELIAAGATASIDAASKAFPALRQQTEAQTRLADASGLGADAEHRQALENVALAATHEAAANAAAKGDPALKERVAVLTAMNLVLQRQNDLEQTRTQLNQQNTQNQNQVAIAQLEMSLQGQTTEEITRQVSLLQEKQLLLSKNIDITKQLTPEEQKIADAYLKSTNQIGLMNEKLAETQRQQDRINNLFTGVGQTISSTLGTAIDNAFSGQKVQDWGTQIKQIIAQIMTQIVQFAFIQPAIGSALEAVGLKQAATQFGSFGSLAGGFAGTGGTGVIGAGVGAASIAGSALAASGIGGSTGTTQVQDSNGNPVGTLSQNGSVLSLASAAGGGVNIFGLGGFTGFLNNIGSSLGFGTTVQGGAPIGGVAGAPFSTTVAGPGVTTVPGSTFGNVTLGSVLGGATAGFGAGSLLNTLVGGNRLGGTVGSGLGGLGGSLGGAVLGTTLFPGIGTLAGALIGGVAGGGAGGLLGGLFGNNRPSNAAGGANVNLGAGGAVSAFQSGGNGQNDQTAQQILSSVSTFTNQLVTLTNQAFPGANARVPGTVAIQAGTRGIQASFAGGVGGTFTENAKDAATAVNQIELQIAQGLTGVSDTLKKVLAQVSDPTQIQSAIQFAAAYDNLKTAADAAFSSISTDVKTIGPFAQAMMTLNTTFGTLTQQATQFGLSLDPINAGLATATKRLRDDFGTALDQALNTANANDYLNSLQAVSQAFATNAQEQQAIGLGGDQATTAKVKQLEATQAASVLSGLTIDQLKQVTAAFATTNPEIAAMSQALISAGISLTSTTTALTTFADGLKAVKDAVTTLSTGPLAGLSPMQQVEQAKEAFQAQLATIQGTSTPTGDQLSQLATLATSAVQTSQNVYGNAPQTADIRNAILTGLNNVATKGTTQAATNATPATNAISNSLSVASAQAAAMTTALQAAATASTTTPSAAPAAAASTNTSANDNGIVSVPQISTQDLLRLSGRGFATGVIGKSHEGTPSGKILVGEKGPEWMLPKGGGWRQVGRTGPEIIDQVGGATILPFPMHPGKRAFAQGTVGVTDVAPNVVGLGSAISEAQGGQSLIGAVSNTLGLGGVTDALSSSLGGVLPVAGPLLGGLLSVALGGNPTSSAIGTAASLIGFALGGPIGGAIGGLVGLIGNLFGPKPSNKASGDLVYLTDGTITDFKSSGDGKADRVVQQISQGIAAESLLMQSATGGTIQGAVSVQAGSRDGIKTSYSGPQGTIDAKWGSADDAISQWTLAIAHNLDNIDPVLRSTLASIQDPNALLPAIQAFITSQRTPEAEQMATAAQQVAQPPAAAPQPPKLYTITQQNGPTYVGSLTEENAKWWQNTGATLTPYSGAQPTARTGASLYQITQQGTGPSYVGDLTQDDVGYWKNAGATVTAYGTLPQARAGADLYSITQGSGPSYLGDLNPDDVTWWKNNTGATVTPSSDGKPPMPRQGAVLYRIDQGSGPWYIGDLMPSDAQWWENLGAKLTPYGASAPATVQPTAAAAMGSMGTPSGRILVGEKGPEWMHPAMGYAGGTAGWQMVGQHGPEVIDQKGGATILPFPKTPWQVAGRAFVDGTADMPAMTFSAPSAPSAVPAGGNPMMHSSTALLDKIDKLNNEVTILRRVTQGGQQDASERGQTGNRHLESINKKIAPPIVAPRRQKLG